MNAPRPTMNDADRRSLREFFATPAGAAVLAQINQPDTIELLPVNQWPDSPASTYERRRPFGVSLDDTEAACDIAPDLTGSHTFRPVYLAQPVSHWPLMLAISVCSASCVAALTWAILSAITKAHT